MRRLLMLATFALTWPAVGVAAPVCVSGSLDSYIALGATGCEISGAVFSDFSSGASFSGGSEISAGNITVNPFLLGLEFVLTAASGTGDLTGVLIGYRLSGTSIDTATLAMTGTSVSPDGVVFAVEDVCADGAFSPFPFCSGTPQTLIVIDDGFGGFLNDADTFAAATFLDVFVDITLDGGLAGTAALDGTVRTAFRAAAPEPSSWLLVGSGMLGVLARRRRRPR